MSEPQKNDSEKRENDLVETFKLIAEAQAALKEAHEIYAAEEKKRETLKEKTESKTPEAGVGNEKED